MEEFLQKNWFEFSQSIGILSTIIFGMTIYWRDSRNRRIDNYFEIVKSHRDIWSMTLDTPDVKTIFEKDPENLNDLSLPPTEERFVAFLFMHLTCAYEVSRRNQMIQIEQLEFDIRDFLSNPRIKNFWEINQRFYNDDFIKFIEKSLTR